MLKKLRKKIVLINMVPVSIVLLLAMLVVCSTMYQSSVQELYRSLQQEAGFSLPSEQPPAHLGQQNNPPVHRPSIPHILAHKSETGDWNIYHDRYISIDEDSLSDALTKIEAAEEDEGLFALLRLAYVRRTTPHGTTVILGDTSTVRVAFKTSVLICAIVFVCSVSVFYAISVVLSRVAVRPVEEAWKQQRQFIADASHELKTPLTVISANNHIMKTHLQETVAQQTQWLNSTGEEIAQMNALINEMLLLARTEDQAISLSLEPANVSLLVEEELLSLEPVAYEKAVTLNSRIEPEITLTTNSVYFKKLLLILVDNAIKYGTHGQPVTITLTGGSCVMLQVHNHGFIAAEDLPHLFDRFYRSDKSRSTSGHGLGLPIAQSIAHHLRGKLTVISTEEDGTTFSVVFKTA